MERIFEYIFKFRDNREVTDIQRFELKTIFPIVTYKPNDRRKLDEIGFFPKKALGLHLIELPKKPGGSNSQ